MILNSLRPMPVASYQVYLCSALHATWQANRDEALPLSPSSFPIDFLKPGKFADGPAYGKGFDSLDFTDYLKTIFSDCITGVASPRPLKSSKHTDNSTHNGRFQIRTPISSWINKKVVARISNIHSTRSL